MFSLESFLVPKFIVMETHSFHILSWFLTFESPTIVNIVLGYINIWRLEVLFLSLA